MGEWESRWRERVGVCMGTPDNLNAQRPTVTDQTMNIRKVFTVPLIVSLFAIVCLVSAADANDAVWRFRFGPFFEFGRDAAGVETCAVRPLYSSLYNPAEETSVRDVVWPVASVFRRGTHEAGRVLIAGWSSDAADESDGRSSQWLFPIYLGGRTRAGERYQALFPLYGEVPELLFMRDIRFTLFPFYLRYRTEKTERRFTPWPLIRRAVRDGGDVRYSFFPVYGSVKKDESLSSYAFWPFWTQEVFEREGRQGRATMLFPVYARTATEIERSWMALPPFIGHGAVSNRTGVTTRTRAPWPFFVREEGPGYARASYWPAYGWRHDQAGSASRRQGYALWPLANYERHQRPGVLFSSDQFIPFYYSDERTVTGRTSGETLHERYTRVWPLWSYQVRDDRFRLRLLELWPMKHGGGIERNWAPFWTWFVRSGEGPARDTDILWGLLRWGGTDDGKRYGQVTALLTWRQHTVAAPWSWRILGLRVVGPATAAVEEVEEQ